MFGAVFWSSSSGKKNSFIFGEDLLFIFYFWPSLKFLENNSSVFGKDFFFGLHLIWLSEKNRVGQSSTPPMLKIGKNWGKIANDSPNAQERLAPLLTKNGLYRLMLF